MIKTIKIFLLLLPTLSLFAQGSPYTRLGLGDVRYSSNARTIGLGGSSIGVADKYSINDFNPASWSGINLTRFQLGLSVVSKSIQSSSSESMATATNFEGFSVAIPIERSLGIVTSFGFVPVTRVAYNVMDKETNPYVGDISREYSGSGGLSKMYIGASYKLPFGLALGAQFEYYFGKIEYYSSVTLPDSMYYNSVNYTNKLGFNGLGSSFGLLSPDLSDLLSSDNVKQLRIGAFVNLAASINTDTSLTSKTSAGNAEVVSGMTKSDIPLKFGLGLSASLFNKFLFVADFMTQDWSTYSRAGKSYSNLTNYQRISAGIETFADHSEFSTFWEQIQYRFGLSYEQSQYEIANKTIKQYELFSGISFPIGVANSLDIALSFGLRGEKDNQLLLEKFFKTSVSLNFGELWFVRRKM